MNFVQFATQYAKKHAEEKNRLLSELDIAHFFSSYAAVIPAAYYASLYEVHIAEWNEGQVRTWLRYVQMKGGNYAG